MTPIILIVGCAGFNDLKEFEPPTEDVTTSTTSTTSSPPTAETTTTTTDTPTDTGDPDPCADPQTAVDFATVECPEGVAAVVDGVGYASVEAALVGVCDGETVVVCPGEWPTAAVIDRAIDLVSRDGPDTTTLTGTTSSVLRIDAADGATVRGLTLKGGVGALYPDFATAEWPGVGSEATFGGGALVTGKATFVDCRVRENTADFGGGIALLGGTAVLNSSLVVDNDAAYGGGAFSDAPAISFIDSGVVRNRAIDGGGVYGTLGVILDAATVEDNVAEGWGGGVLCRHLDAGDSTFRHNGANAAGGIYVSVPVGDETGRLVSSLVEGNIAITRAGGLFLSDSHALGDFLVSGTTFSGNIASKGGGMVFVGGNGAKAQVDTTLFEGNYADAGGGLYTAWRGTAPSLALVDVDFDANVAVEDGGALVGQIALSITGGTMGGNTSARGGGISVREGSVEVADLDFGDGNTENRPDDVATPTETWDVDGPTSFSCWKSECNFPE